MGHNASDFFSFARPVVSGMMPSAFGGLGVKNGATDNPPADPTSSNLGDSTSSPLFQHTWLIVCFVGVVIVWLVIFIVILLCRRQRRQRVKQRFPPNAGAVSEEVAFRMKRGGGGSMVIGGSRNSKVGLLELGKESDVTLTSMSQSLPQQQQPMLPPSARVKKHSSPRLQMGTGILTVPRPTAHVTSAETAADHGYDAPGKSSF